MTGPTNVLITSRAKWVMGIVVCLAALPVTPVCGQQPRPEPPHFERDIVPLLKNHCVECHGARRPRSRLDVRTLASLLRGGVSGPALVPGSAEKSLLYRVVRDKEMPPDEKNLLPDPKVALVKRWIDSGAHGEEGRTNRPDASAGTVTAQDRLFWSFRKLAAPSSPKVNCPDRVRTPVDAFVAAKLEGKALTFSPDADRTALVRRAFFDLTGLPPSPEEVEAFVSDRAPDAYEKLIDRLLKSPHFGERWARHWLDVAGYVDVNGSDNDAAIIKVAENKWLFRDYVIDAFNQDRPFDRFLTEQLAGDELVDWRNAKTFTPQIKELLIATGFLRVAADDTDANELNTLDIRHAVVGRTVETAVSNLLGLTINCARCHDHKYDPIPQKDYYRLAAILNPALDPNRWLQPQQRLLPAISPAEKADAERHNADVDRRIAALKKQVADLLRPYEERLFDQKLARLPEPIRVDTRTAVRTPAAKRNEIQKYLAGKFEAMLQVKPEEVAAALSPPDRTALDVDNRKIAELNGQRKTWENWQAVTDCLPPGPTYVLRRGNHEAPGGEVPAGFVSVLCASDADVVAKPVPVPGSSGRRLALARWLTDPNQAAAALVARVYVNRVWQHLFEKGIVETSDNFGRNGAAPTHPELLEWLAGEFINGGWRTKPLLRLIMTSTVYRQASASTQSAGPAVDPDNRLLWRQRLRRLQSESVRDALLAVSSKLVRTVGGPPALLENRPDGLVVIQEKGMPPEFKNRRSLYVLARRNYHLSMLNVFDQPAVATNCTCRNPSAVVLQSLAMLNDAFVLEQAEGLAGRVAKAVSQPEQWIDRAFRITLGRPPKPQETHWGTELLQKQAHRYKEAGLQNDVAAQKALAELCHVLVNANEFLYVP